MQKSVQFLPSDDGGGDGGITVLWFDLLLLLGWSFAEPGNEDKKLFSSILTLLTIPVYTLYTEGYKAITEIESESP